jgi:hypothetical protein
VNLPKSVSRSANQESSGSAWKACWAVAAC